jgi:hypothetical protein
MAAEVRALMARGLVVEARQYLDDLTADLEPSGDPPGAVAAAHLAALVSRILGDLDGAERRARSALRLARPGSFQAVGAETELGEVALARHQPAAAAVHYAKALDHARTAGWSPHAWLHLAARRAHVLALAGDVGAAEEAFGEFGRALAELGEDGLLRAELIQAAALQSAGYGDAGTPVRIEASRRAAALGDHGALAELALLEVARGLERGETDTAIEAAERARAESLLAVNPLTYLAAAVAIAELADRRNDRSRAYQTMATALVTLADVVGRASARALAEPELVALKERWGETEFAAVKARHDEMQRTRPTRTAGACHLE